MGIQLKIGGAITGRKFTDPIRYFKANDPYYWEVDNIPLKQLQENCRYLNDRLNTAVLSGNMEINRTDISELKPWVNGSDFKIRVKPGRYTARINDAHGTTAGGGRLESFYKTATEIGAYTNYSVIQAPEASVPPYSTILTRIRSSVAEDALNLNGMSERVFAYMAQTPHFGPALGDIDPNFPQLTIPLQSNNSATHSQAIQNPFPLTEYISWFRWAWSAQHRMGSNASKAFESFRVAGDPNELLNLAFLENVLVRYWRGTARTSVVDIPNGLEIDIPPFDEKDFFYINSKGVRIELGSAANSRIDLVFIYSKPVDVSSIDIAKYTGTPATWTSISEPILGIVRGAGLGLDEDQTVTNMSNANVGGEGEGYKHKAAINTGDGVSKIMASIADQNNTDNGFDAGVNQKVPIRGSFPSPEDLMNLAPLLGEELKRDSWLLTGQTVFPVAYVKVNRGSAVIVDDDIVDIRPLFRTAELTYNERAGIAAAVPPLSLANRAVGRYELEYEVIKHYEDLDNRLTGLAATVAGNAAGTGVLTSPTVVGGGYIFGGKYWGVEGTLIQGLQEAGMPNFATNANIENKLGVPLGSVQDHPDWDVAPWAWSSSTQYPNDWIHHARAAPYDTNSKIGTRADYGLYRTTNTAAGIDRYSFGLTDGVNGDAPYLDAYYVKKTITFNHTLLQGLSDYKVDVQLINCVPITTDYNRHHAYDPGAPVGVWVTKDGASKTFTIHVSWKAGASHAGNSTRAGSQSGSDKRYPYQNRTNASLYAGMVVIDDKIHSGGLSLPNVHSKNQPYSGQSAMGVALYPTVAFTITGLPAGFLNYSLRGRSGSIITPRL